MSGDTQILERLERLTNAPPSTQSVTQKEKLATTDPKPLETRIEQIRQKEELKSREHARKNQRSGGMVTGGPGQEYYEQLKDNAEKTRQNRIKRYKQLTGQ